MKRIFTLPLSIVLFACRSFASELDGTWEGTNLFRGGDYPLENALQKSRKNQVGGEVRHTFNDDSAVCRISETLKLTKIQRVFKRGQQIKKIKGAPRFGFKGEPEVGSQSRVYE